MKNNMKKVLSLLLAVLMMASLSVTAFAEEGDFDGDSLSGYNAFYYTVTKEDVYTDISGVKLSWSVPIVKYTETNTLTWNTTDLKWEQTNPVSKEGTAVSFTLTNRGSYAVIASASFALEDSLKKDDTVKNDKDAASVSFDKNDVTLESIVNATTKAKKNAGTDTSDVDYLTQNCTATIKGTVSIDNADKLSNGTGKLGTYTVSIRNTVHTVTVSYLKNAADEELTVETITVDDNTEISVTENVLKIGTNEYTTAAATAEAVDFSGWCSAPLQLLDVNTVTADMNITPAYWIS